MYSVLEKSINNIRGEELVGYSNENIAKLVLEMHTLKLKLFLL